MAWDPNKTDSTQLTNIDTEQFFDETPTLADNGRARCQVSVTFPASSDDAVIAIYETLDDSSPVWDLEPNFEIILPSKASATNRITFNVSGPYRFRVGVRRQGSTGTFTNADMSHRLVT